jgi:hypothetical protein
MAPEKKKILFLTSQDPTQQQAAWPIDEHLRQEGAEVHLHHWRDPTLDVETLSTFDRVAFLWCLDYPEHGHDFRVFLQDRLKPAQQNGTLVTLNDVNLVLWNMDKVTYLPELICAGFPVVDTTFYSHIASFSTAAELMSKVQRVGLCRTGDPIILKPSISASAKLTHLVKNPKRPTSSDIAYLENLLAAGLECSFMLQTFEPNISEGEYSLIFLAGHYSHTMLKTPKSGEFRCQSEFGGDLKRVAEDEVPLQAKNTAEAVIQYIAGESPLPDGKVLKEPTSPTYHKYQIAYARVDGIIRTSGDFIIMEVELIEPELWVDENADPIHRDAFYRLFI